MDCLGLVASSTDTVETVRWYTEAAETAILLARPRAGQPADSNAAQRADQYAQAAIDAADHAVGDATMALLAAKVRAIRVAARIKDECLRDADGAVALARRGRQALVDAPCELTDALDRMFAGTEAFASREANVLARLGRTAEAMAAVDSMSVVSHPKQPRSFYADRVAAEVEAAGLGSRAAILRDYLDRHDADEYTPAVRYNLAAALLREHSAYEAVRVLQELLSNDAGGLRAIDERRRQRGALRAGEPGWADSAEFLLGQALVATENSEAVPYLRRFAESFPGDTRAPVARGLIHHFER